MTPPSGPVTVSAVAPITDVPARWPRPGELPVRAAPPVILLGQAADVRINLEIDGERPSGEDLLGSLHLLIGGGFDTTTALTAHAIEWLGGNPAEGERLWLSWAMADRDPSVFPDPDEIHLAREGNRHTGFGLGVHRCIGSNVARTLFKRMLVQVLDRMPDYTCDPEDTVHYETIGVINGMRFLPATFTPGPRLGPGLDETLEKLQKACDEQGIAGPVTRRGARKGP